MCIGCTSTCKDGSGERFRLPAADDEVRERVGVEAVVPFRRLREDVADPLHMPTRRRRQPSVGWRHCDPTSVGGQRERWWWVGWGRMGWGDGPVLVVVGGDGGGGGGLDVGRRGEVREALGEVDGADALRQVGQLLDGRRPGPPRRRRQPPLHGVAPRARAPAWQRGGRSDKVRSGSAQLS